MMDSENNILNYLLEQRWCNFKQDILQNNVSNASFNGVDFDNGKKRLVIGKVEFNDKEPRYFLMPLAQADKNTEDLIVKIDNKFYTDAVKKDDFWSSLNAFLKESGNSITIPEGWSLEYHGISDDIIKENENAKSKPLNVEQSNSTIVVGDKKIAFKLERMLAFSDCENTEIEMNKKLMNEGCSVMPSTYGYLLLRDKQGNISSAGIMQEFVPNKGDLWNYSIKYLKNRLQYAYLTNDTIKPSNNPEFMDLMQILSSKTEEMSRCLSNDDANPNFTPESVDEKFVRTYDKQLSVLLYQTKRNIVENLDKLPHDSKKKASYMLDNWEDLTQNFIQRQLKQINASKDKGFTCRVHGDFHLGQVMVTKDNDLRFIDFAGEPGLSAEQRKQKHIYVRDYAGMYRSIYGYMGAVAVEEFANMSKNPEDVKKRKVFAQRAIKPLITAASKKFLGNLPTSDPWLKLEIFRKNLYEVNYEVCNRQSMAYVPINGLADLLKENNANTYINKKINNR